MTDQEEKPFAEQIKEWDAEKLLDVIEEIAWRMHSAIDRADYARAKEYKEELLLLKYEVLQRIKKHHSRMFSNL